MKVTIEEKKISWDVFLLNQIDDLSRSNKK